MANVINEAGFAYVVERIAGAVRYVRCRNNLQRCRARGIKINDRPINLRRPHCHGPADVPANNALQDFRRELILTSRRTFLPIRLVYDIVSAQYQHVVHQLRFNSVATNMRAARRRVNFPEITSIAGLNALLYNDIAFRSLRRYHRDNILQVNHVGQDALIIGDVQFIRTLNLQTIYSSSTTTVVPNMNNLQLMTYIAGESNGYVFPVVLILWASRTPAVCAAVSTIIKMNFIQVDPTQIYTDYDLQLYFRHVYPNSHITIPYHNYCQMILQDAKNFNVDMNVNAIKDFVKRCMGLMLVPEDRIADGFIEILNSIPPHLVGQLEPFINCIEDKWIRRNQLNQISSFNEVIGVRDTNIMMTREFQYRCGNQNLNIWSFLKNVNKFMHIASTDALRMNGPLDPRLRLPRTNRSCLDTVTLQRQWTLLNDDVITVTEFLDALLPIQELHFNNLVYNAEILIRSQLSCITLNNLRPQNDGAEMVCQICFERTVGVVCEPCLHVEVCTICADQITAAAANEGMHTKCPICNSRATFNAGRFTINANNSLEMICQLCRLNEIDVVCTPCLDIKMCSACARIRVETAQQMNTNITCPFCAQDCRFGRGYFPH